MKTVYRIDRAPSSLLTAPVRSDEGYLFVEGYATRAGVFEYRDAKGNSFFELRPPEEVGNPESLASLARKPMTNLHPKEFVDAKNADRYAIGTVDPDVVWEKDFQNGFVKVRATIQRKDGVDAIDKGRRELSCGYSADLDYTPGVWTDAQGVEHRYDAIQRNIRYNHLALVDKGRAGDLAALRADSDDAIMVVNDSPTEPKQAPTTPQGKTKESSIMPFKIDGREYSAEETGAIQRAIDEIVAQRNDAKTNADKLSTELATIKPEFDVLKLDAKDKQKSYDELKAEFDAMKKELDAMKAKKADGADEVSRLNWFNERASLIETAKSFKVDEAELKGENDAIKRAIALTKFDEADLPSQAHIDAAFTLMIRSQPSTTEKVGNIIMDSLGKPTRNDEHVKAAEAYTANRNKAFIGNASV